MAGPSDRRCKGKASFPKNLLLKLSTKPTGVIKDETLWLSSEAGAWQWSCSTYRTSLLAGLREAQFTRKKRKDAGTCKRTKKRISPLSQLALSYVTSQDYFCLLSFLCYAFRISLFPLRVWGIQNEGYLYTGVAETLQFSISKTQLTKLGNIYSICWNQHLTSSIPSSIN